MVGVLLSKRNILLKPVLLLSNNLPLDTFLSLNLNRLGLVCGKLVGNASIGGFRERGSSGRGPLLHCLLGGGGRFRLGLEGLQLAEVDFLDRISYVTDKLVSIGALSGVR